MKIWCLNDAPYDTAGHETMVAAQKRGHQSSLFKKAADAQKAGGYVMARLHQWEPRIWEEREELMVLQADPRYRFVQDTDQLRVYEDKIAQAAYYERWMPETHVWMVKDVALAYAEQCNYPLISKSAIGSASLNVRLIKTKEEAVREVEACFGKSGLKITKGIQRGYVYWQRFIPHTETFRVCIVGTKLHAYKRFNYDHRPMAAPSKVKPTQPVPQAGNESLLEWSEGFFDAIGTKFCAIDVLRHEGKWWLLETSLAWARGKDPAGLAPFYGTKYNLMTQHTLLIEEIEKGVFG